jgi:hypothetical protein
MKSAAPEVAAEAVAGTSTSPVPTAVILRLKLMPQAVAKAALLQPPIVIARS